jgi:hypothetical protein
LDRFEHRREAFVDLPRVVAGAIPREKEFQNEGRYVGALLDLLQEVLADHLPCEDFVQFLVERVLAHSK